MTRQRVVVALACGGIPVGMAGGVLAGRDLPDVLVVGVALAVLAVWTLTAGYVGALIQRRGEADRLDEAIDMVLHLREHADQVDIDALIEATKEDR